MSSNYILGLCGKSNKIGNILSSITHTKRVHLFHSQRVNIFNCLTRCSVNKTCVIHDLLHHFRPSHTIVTPLPHLWRIHLSVLRYRWTKNSFAGPKSSRSFWETDRKHSITETTIGDISLRRKEKTCDGWWYQQQWREVLFLSVYCKLIGIEITRFLAYVSDATKHLKTMLCVLFSAP